MNLRAVCLGLAVISLAIFDRVDALRQPFLKLVEEYRSALMQSRLRLVQASYEIMNDKVLLDHLLGSRSHGLNQSLFMGLRTGLIDRVALFDSDCSKLATAAQASDAYTLNCSFGKDGLSWDHSDQGFSYLILQRVQKIQDKNYILVASLKLDANWLVQYPNLAALMRNLRGRIGPYTPAGAEFAPRLLYSEGQNVDVFQASLWTDSNIGLFIGPFVRATSGIGNPYAWSFFLVAFVSWILGLGVEKRRRRADELDRTAFLAWCENLNLERPGLCEANLQFHGADQAFFGFCQKALVGGMRSALDWQAEQRRLKEELQAELAEKEDSLRVIRQNLIDKTEHESLALQIKQSAYYFAKAMAELDAQLLKLYDTIKGELMLASTELFQQAKAWQGGIAQRGARKFLRSLYESSAEGGEDRLSDEVKVFLNRSMSIAERTVQASLIAEKLRPRFFVYSKVLANWYGLALKDDIHSVSAVNLQELVQDACELTHLSGVGIKIKTFDIAQEPISLTMPPAILVSALHHVLMLVAQAGNDEIEYCALRKRQNSYFLNLRLTNFVMPKNAGPQRTAHKEIAEWLLATYGGRCQLIPAINTYFVFSISWPLEWGAKWSKRPRLFRSQP